MKNYLDSLLKPSMSLTLLAMIVMIAGSIFIVVKPVISGDIFRLIIFTKKTLAVVGVIGLVGGIFFMMRSMAGVHMYDERRSIATLITFAMYDVALWISFGILSIRY